MQYEIPFNDIMKNHKYWHDDCDFDIMEENYHILKPLMHLCFFAEKPKHPKVFSLLFSEKGFANDLIESAIKLNIHDIKRIWFAEFSEEDRNELIKKGFYQLFPNMFGAVATCFMANDEKDELFVNVVL